MKIHALKDLRHDRLGRIQKGKIVDMPEQWARIYIQMGAAEAYQTKVIRETPLAGAGAALPSSSSPVDQASQPTTSSESDNGEKPKRKRRSKASSSQTQPTE